MTKFNMGRLYATAAIHSRMREERQFEYFVRKSMRRYENCDWGDSCEEDKALNDEAVINGDRIFATYIYSTDNTKIWIITESDRSATTVLFPDEY